MATVAQWLRSAAEPKDAGSIPGAGTAFQMQAKSENACVLRGVKINPESSAMVHLIAQVWL